MLGGALYAIGIGGWAMVFFFGDPILEVLNYPDSEAEWDMENADLIGLQEANGVLFRENAQLYGVVAP